MKKRPSRSVYHWGWIIVSIVLLAVLTAFLFFARIRNITSIAWITQIKNIPIIAWIIKLELRFTIIALIFSLGGSVVLCIAMYRWTYRIFPNLFLAVSFFVFYTILLSVARDDQHLLGLGIMKDELVTLFLTDNFTKWLGWSVLGTSLATVVAKASEDLWHGLGRSTTDDYVKLSYRFKQQRRKLLTYRGNYRTPLGYMMVFYILGGLVTSLLLFIKKKGVPLQLLISLFFVGAAAALVGFVLHQFITDDHLLRSERTYIKKRQDAALKRLDDGKDGGTGWEWGTYCQVTANVYSSRSPILYENKRIHDDISPLAAFSVDYCTARFLADAVNAFREIHSLYCSSEAKSEQLAQELQFAKALEKTVLNDLAKIKEGRPTTDPKDSSVPGIAILACLYDAFKSFFLDAEHPSVEKQWFYVPSIGNQDSRRLLLLDCLQELASHQEATDNCPLCWICEHKDNTLQLKYPCRNATKVSPKELALLCLKLPFVIETALEVRWHKKIHAYGTEQFTESMTHAFLNYYCSDQIKYILYKVKDSVPNDIDYLIEAFTNYHLSLNLKKSRFDLIDKYFDMIILLFKGKRTEAELAKQRIERVDPNQAAPLTQIQNRKDCTKDIIRGLINALINP